MLYSTRSVQCSFFLFNLFSRWRHRCVKRKNTCSACCVRNVAGGESLRPKLANSGELAATPPPPHPATLLDHLPLFRKTGKQVTASDIMWQLMIFGWHHKASGIRGLLYVTSMASDELIWWEMTKKSNTVVTRLLVPFGPVLSAQWTKSFCVPKNTHWEKVVLLARTRQVNMWIMFLTFLWQITFWWRGHW